MVGPQTISQGLSLVNRRPPFCVFWPPGAARRKNWSRGSLGYKIQFRITLHMSNYTKHYELLILVNFIWNNFFYMAQYT